MNHNRIIYENICHLSSKMVTKKYSTSFYKSIQFFPKEMRKDIYNIYGFVRFADEIVDTFHEFDKRFLLKDFYENYKIALEKGISMNPVLHSFCATKKKYHIPDDLVEAFLYSMEMDLGDIKYLNDEQYKQYIYGSAEVVGLMCLKVFTEGNETEYEILKPYAQAFGAALQKINFLRDVSEDFTRLNRTYFPNIDFLRFSEKDKIQIERDIEQDLDVAYRGIKKLPVKSKFAVYLGYRYYGRLFRRIQKTNHQTLFTQRISVSRYEKSLLFIKVFVRQQFHIM